MYISPITFTNGITNNFNTLFASEIRLTYVLMRSANTQLYLFILNIELYDKWLKQSTALPNEEFFEEALKS